MRKTTVLIAASLMFLARPTAADIALGGSLDDDQVSLVYAPKTGELSVDSGGNVITMIEIDSKAEYFKNLIMAR